jgi:hypothetical protein
MSGSTTDHACDWCNGTPARRVVMERARWSGPELLKRPIYAFACPSHEEHGLTEDEDAEPIAALSMRRRKDRTAVQLDLFPDDRRPGGGSAITNG